MYRWNLMISQNKNLIMLYSWCFSSFISIFVILIKIFKATSLNLNFLRVQDNVLGAGMPYNREKKQKSSLHHPNRTCVFLLFSRSPSPLKFRFNPPSANARGTSRAGRMIFFPAISFLLSEVKIQHSVIKIRQAKINLVANSKFLVSK